MSNDDYSNHTSDSQKLGESMINALIMVGFMGTFTFARFFYAHFYMAHISGHHKHVATPEDPATP